MATDIIFLTQKFWCFLSRPTSFNIFINVLHSLEKTPKALIYKLINLTVLKWSLCCVIRSLYLSLLRSTLFWRLDSYPTESSSMYRQSFEMERSRSGRLVSPVNIGGLLCPGRSTNRVELWSGWNIFENRVMSPSKSWKVWLASRDYVQKGFRVQADGTIRVWHYSPFCDVFACGKSVVDVTMVKL
jgi:hypothetical protein